MADKFQTEVTRSLRHAGFWAEKFVDMRFVDKKTGATTKEQSGTVREYPLKGRPDMYWIRGRFGGFVEVKSGQGEFGERFSFDQWSEDQRLWYAKYGQPLHTLVWMWLTLGISLRSKEYPRTSYLFPVEELLTIEKSHNYKNGAPKKSLNFSEAGILLAPFKLEWDKEGKVYTIDPQHPFRKALE